MPETTILPRLHTLSFDAFARIMALLLTRLGYTEVTAAGREHWKGRNGKDGHTGYDLTANLSGGASTRRVIIQIKQFAFGQRIYQRTVDELRGATLRAEAAEALLLTTGSFSPTIDRTALQAESVVPIATLDGVELAARLLQHRIGFTSRGELDEALFRRLEADATGNGPLDCLGATEVLVTVGIQRVPKREKADSLRRV